MVLVGILGTAQTDACRLSGRRFGAAKGEAPVAEGGMIDSLIVLHSTEGKFATKRFTRFEKTGKIVNRSYDNAFWFRVERIVAAGFLELCAALNRLTRSPHAFVIRGEPAAGINPNHTKRRFRGRATDSATFIAASRYWFAVDLDHLPCPVTQSVARSTRPTPAAVERPGYDEETGILFDPQGIEFEPVPPLPTKHGAEQALDEIREFFDEFDFADDASKAVHLSAVLSVVARLAFRFLPLHAYDSPVAGTGKSKLVDCCAIVGTGHECAVISPGNDELEFEKRLGAVLLAGERYISFDNCEHPLGGPLLCQALTQSRLQIRRLGFSESVEIPNRILPFATGNNLDFVGDVTRRAIKARLDAGVERPEMRSFKKSDPVERMKQERGEIAVAALTVLRAYQVAGRPAASTTPLGGFEGWSQQVRDPLIWLGEADPVKTMEDIRKHDPRRQTLEAVLEQWKGDSKIAGKSCTTADLVEHANEREPSPDNPKELFTSIPNSGPRFWPLAPIGPASLRPACSAAGCPETNARSSVSIASSKTQCCTALSVGSSIASLREVDRWISGPFFYP
jgi:hypothetical protein